MLGDLKVVNSGGLGKKKGGLGHPHFTHFFSHFQGNSIDTCC